MKKLIVLLLLAFVGLAVNAQSTDSTINSQPASQKDAGCVASAQTDTAQTKQGFVARVGTWYTNHLSYLSVTALMALESSFIPFPSEIVVPPAAYAACNSESPLYTTDSKILNVLLVVLFATLGALLGALLNYAISFFLGRPFIYWFVDTKFGHLCLLNGEKVKKAEDYFVEHGNVSTLVGRLIPVIRQLISIPAGLAKMRLTAFVGYTTLGALLWNVILAVLGYIAHGQQDLISKYSDELSWLILAVFAIAVIVVVVKAIRKKKLKKSGSNLKE